ncbi:MAG TPA: RDD family protein [Candidatus Nitrosotenuis sp.]|jgi:uncharacterized RDD family membrane protein YckC|nr:RDD family protein [Candidatus Nitrosotenuis sp.]
MKRAGIFRRCAAFGIDCTLILGGWILLSLVLGILSGFLALPALPVGFTALTFTTSLLYFPTLESHYGDGQTPGKKAVGIRVVSGDGRSASLAQGFLRYLGGMVGFLTLGLGFLFDVTDAVSGTRVIIVNAVEARRGEALK